MIHDIFLEAGWRDCIALTIDDDVKVQADVDRQSFLNALDNISDDISEWICQEVERWFEEALDFDGTTLNEEQIAELMTRIREVRP